jgi:hypothetical protein
MALTAQRTILALDAPYVATKVAALNERILAKGLGEPVVADFGPVVRPNEYAIAAYYGALALIPPGAPTPPPPRPTVQVTITYTPPVLPGGWELVAVADFTGADTALVFNLADDLDLGADDVDATQCDHCHTARRRNTVYVVRDEAGQLARVGSTCVGDFLGLDPTKVLNVYTVLGELDDDEFYNGGGGPVTIPTVEFVAAAKGAVDTFGWAKASAEDPTKAVASAILFGVPRKDDGLDEARDAYLAAADFAAEAITWAQGLEPRSDFDRNMIAVAASDTIGPKAFGVAAYLPVAYARFLDQAAAKVAEKAAEAAGPQEDVPEGRVELTGTVVGLKVVESDFGATEKMTVRDDRGFRVWVTVPSAIAGVERGQRVTLTATVTPSDDDPKFGFGKRPAKAEVLEPELAGVA